MLVCHSVPTAIDVSSEHAPGLPLSTPGRKTSISRMSHREALPLVSTRDSVWEFLNEDDLAHSGGYGQVDA
jgi:hypothetical protein